MLTISGALKERKDQTRPDQTRQTGPTDTGVASIRRAVFDSQFLTLLFSTLRNHNVVLAVRQIRYILTFTMSHLSALVDMDFIPGAFWVAKVES